MSSFAHIRILPAHALDKDKWDACVAADNTALIYSRSWYLDCIADEWYGLVVGDYEAIMPLPLKRKWTLRMVYTPPFIQRLGIAGRPDEQAQKAMRDEALRFCKLLLYASSGDQLFPNASKKQRTNYVLALKESYQAIAAQYTVACRKNLNKAQTRSCIFMNDVGIEDVIALYKDAYGNDAAYTPEHYVRLEKLLHTAVEKRACHIAGVRDEVGALAYAGLLLDDGRRLYYLLGAPTTKGRQMRATYFFIDAMIQRFAGTGKVLDFEGSDIPAVAQFYQSFNPQREHYYDYYINQYTFPFGNILDRYLKPF